MAGFIPHGHCYLWKPGLVWLHVVADGTIALAYFSIPITLLYFISKRRDVPFTWIFGLFSAFILLCGSGHLIDIWTLWHPNYWMAGLVKALTAIVSATTAIELIPLVPLALALPKPAELEIANQELQATIRKLQKTQLQLIQSEKMSSLGELVAGIAHEINNPVNFIHGNLTHVDEYAHQLLRIVKLYQHSYPHHNAEIAAAIEEIDLDFIQEDLPMILTSMQVGTERISQTVRSLRNFSRLDEAEMKRVDIHEGIESTLLLLQNRLRVKPDQPNIAIVKEFVEIPLVQCYAGQLNQVFMNLLTNAIDALEEDPKFIEVNTEVDTEVDTKVDATPTIWIRTRQLEPDWVQVEVSNNGVEIPELVRQKIFNPFFTTKPIGKGTGLGLSISYQTIVEKHGGELECFSTAEQGTTFQIKIPTQQSGRCVLPDAHVLLATDLLATDLLATDLINPSALDDSLPDLASTTASLGTFSTQQFLI